MVLALGAGLFLAVIALGIFAFWLRTTSVESPAKKLRERACPLCGAALREDESLRAVMAGIDASGREEIRIRGCPHCLRPES